MNEIKVVFQTSSVNPSISIEWSSESAELSYRISDSDMNVLNNVLMGVDGVVSIKFRVYAVIPGSDT